MTEKKTVDEAYKLQKKKNNGFVYGLYWDLSLYCVKLFEKNKVSPNAVTIAAFVLYYLAGYCFFKGEYFFNMLGGVLFFFGILMDCTDGKLARATKNKSDMGIWLDYNFDSLKVLLIYPPIAISLYRSSYESMAFVYAMIIITVTLTYSIITERFASFPYSQEGKEGVTKSKFHAWAKELYAHECIEPLVLIFFAFINFLYGFLVIWSIYMAALYLATAYLYGRTVAEHDRNQK